MKRIIAQSRKKRKTSENLDETKAPKNLVKQ